MAGGSEKVAASERMHSTAAAAERSFIKTYPGAAPLLEFWAAVDKDGDGYLSEPELKLLCKRLRVQWSTSQLWKEAIELAARDDTQLSMEWKDDVVDFPLFVQIYQSLMGVERRSVRNEVKITFERLDTDRSGGINKGAIEKLYKSLRKVLRLLPPGFEIEADWKLMIEMQGGEDLVRGQSSSNTGAGFVASATGVVQKTPGSPIVREPEVSFEVFESWWKMRMGLLEADTPVLPEFFAHRLKQVKSLSIESSRPSDGDCGEPGSGSTTLKFHKRPAALSNAQSGVKRSGRELWNFLVPRLYALARMKKQWGPLQSVYGYNESAFGEPRLPSTIRDPESTFSVVWDLLQILFLLYVSITVPFRTCFEVEIPVGTATWWWDMVIDVYFISDLLLSFRTAFVNDKGIRVADPAQIRNNYLKGWFMIDFVSCVPVGHIAALLEPSTDEVVALATGSISSGDAGGVSSNSNNLRALKALRLVRLSKMLRLARLKRIMQKYENLMELQQYMGILVMLCTIVFTAHFLTCMWYAVGNTNEELGGYTYVNSLPGADTEVFEQRGAGAGANTASSGAVNTKIPGWVAQQSWGKTPGPRAEQDVEYSVSTSTRYIASMYFVFNALDNFGTDLERMVGVFAYLCTILIDGAVAGVMSALLVGMSGADREINDKLRAAKRWMVQSRVPRLKQMQALAFFAHYYKANELNEEELLSTMPPAMAEDFRTHLYHKFLMTVPLFRGCSHQVISAICGMVEPMNLAKGQLVFAEQTRGKELYMLMVGELEVTQRNERLGFLSDGAFFGEVPLLDDSEDSELRQRTVTTMTDSKLCFLTKENLTEVRSRYPELDLRLRRFSRRQHAERNGKQMVAKGKKMQEASALKQQLQEQAEVKKWLADNEPQTEFHALTDEEIHRRAVDLQTRGADRGGIDPIKRTSSIKGHGGISNIGLLAAAQFSNMSTKSQFGSPRPGQSSHDDATDRLSAAAVSSAVDTAVAAAQAVLRRELQEMEKRMLAAVDAKLEAGLSKLTDSLASKFLSLHVAIANASSGEADVPRGEEQDGSVSPSLLNSFKHGLDRPNLDLDELEQTLRPR